MFAATIPGSITISFALSKKPRSAGPLDAAKQT